LTFFVYSDDWEQTSNMPTNKIGHNDTLYVFINDNMAKIKE